VDKSNRPDQGQNTPRGAVAHRVDVRDKLRSWLNHHLEVSVQSLRRMLLTPVATLMTLAVLAIALALPGFMLTALQNIQQLGSGWDTDPRIALYINAAVSDERVEQFSMELMLHDGLSSVELIERARALQDFSEYSGFGDLLTYFDSNPLPAVVLVLPVDQTEQGLLTLQAELDALPEVEDAVVDMLWIQRLQAYISLAERFSWVLAGLLGLTVLLVVGNTIRMTLESRRDEIIVAKLVGATDAWVRRPFLYSGFWYGLLGALLAWVLVQGALWLMADTVNQLAQLYMSGFSVQGLGVKGSLLLLLTGLLLGVSGGWLVTGRHLREIEPT